MINSNKTFATTAVLAVIMTVTALALASSQSSWDGALLTDSGYDSSAATTAAIPNMPDVWSAFDAVSDVMSFEWLIPSAFAAPTIVSVNGETLDSSDYVYISTTEGTATTLTVVATGNGTLIYEWQWFSGDQPIDFTVTNTDTITFTAPTVDEDLGFVLAIDVNDDGGMLVYANIDLTVLDAGNTTNALPMVYAGPDLPAVTKGQPLQLAGATATDTDTGDTLIYAWSATPSSAVTFDNDAVLNPEITVSNTVTDGDVIRLTLTVNDGTVDVSDTRRLTIQDAVVTNTAPTIGASGPLSIALGTSLSLNPTITDRDGTTNHVYTWTAPPDTVTFSNVNLPNPTITTAANATKGTVTLTLTIVDGEHTVVGQITLNIFDPNENVAPTIDNIDDVTVKERTSVTLTATARDPNAGDTPTYLWDDRALPTGTVATGNTTKSLKFTAPGISSGTETFAFTLTVTDQGGETATSNTVTVTVEDVPLKVSSVTYNPGNGQLRITFNQSIEPSPSYGSIHVRSADSSSGGISLSDVDVKSSDRAVITATLSTEQKETYADLQNPQIDIDSGAVSDADGTSIGATPDMVITTISNKKSSSSSSAPIVDLTRLVQARIVDIPSVISEQVSSRNAGDPLEPILDNSAFDFPLTINDYSYLLDSTTNTLTPRAVITGQSTEIEFTVYTDEDLAHFTLYLNLQDDDTRYADSDTYITYTNDGTVAVTDPNNYIADATITVTQDDSSMPEKKTVTITIEFDEPMGLTNMIAYMWNTDRRSAIINLIDAIDVTADAETRQNSASSADSSTSARVTPEPDVSDDNRSDGGGSQSSINSGIAVIGGDANDDDVQTLLMIRMWSGFESESITDAELLESMGLDNYPTVHIPDWVMTELGALVSNSDVTVEEFRTALIYMLEMLTA